MTVHCIFLDFHVRIIGATSNNRDYDKTPGLKQAFDECVSVLQLQ